MFTKKDLKTGDFVEYRDGTIRFVVNDQLIGVDGYGVLDVYSDKLTFDACSDLDIVKVYRGRYTFNTATKGTVVFDRKKDVVEEMTLEEVCKALGKNIKIVKRH